MKITRIANDWMASNGTRTLSISFNNGEENKAPSIRRLLEVRLGQTVFINKAINGATVIIIHSKDEKNLREAFQHAKKSLARSLKHFGTLPIRG